jgi:hypothetical protein
MAKYRVAYAGAGGVPIAVPESCCQYVSPKENTLLRMISSMALIRAATGMLGKRGWLRRRYPDIFRRALFVSMLVYIDTASAVRREIFPVSRRAQISALRTAEFFM